MVENALARRGNWRALPRQPLQTSQGAQTLKRRLGYVSLKLACVQDALTKSGTITFAKAKLVVQITQLKLLCEINLDALAFRDVWRSCQTKPSFIWRGQIKFEL